MSDRTVAVIASLEPNTGWARVRATYFHLLLVLTLLVALVSFFRDRGQLLSNVSSWLFLIPFGLTLWSTTVGLLAAVLLLTVGPSIHEQVNALLGTSLHAWAYPAVDSALGFLAAWALKGKARGTGSVLDRFPSGPLMLFHAWMTLSAAIAVGRNIWQSASEFTVRGVAYNAYLARGISWHDDYYPLQDPFFYGVALLMIFAVWSLLQQGGDRLLRRLVGVVLAGASANVLFALWQKATGGGWINGYLHMTINAFWPDLHSFGVFMASALGIGFGYLIARRRSPAIWIAFVASAMGLYMSGSRSTLFLVSAAVVVWAFFAAKRLQGSKRAVAIVAAVAAILAVHVVLLQGYRGFGYAAFMEADPSPATLNVLLSHRPEIWATAVRMYLEFPFFGLGQGVFYRLSILPDFSGSPLLMNLGGDGVHNELLRMLVELGPIGIGLALFMAIPYLRLGRQNFRWISFYALVGIAIGSVYTNALLVRELLLLFAVFAGSYFWEVQTAAPASWRLPTPRTMRLLSTAMAVLGLAALLDAALSFGRYPFAYGQRCFQVQPLAKDGWTLGVARLPVSAAAVIAEVSLSADRPDLLRRPLDLDASILSSGGALLATQRFRFERPDEAVRKIELVLPEGGDGERYLELKPSHCYVPLNLGITYDPRRLGVQVKELRFRTATGGEVK